MAKLNKHFCGIRHNTAMAARVFLALSLLMMWGLAQGEAPLPRGTPRTSLIAIGDVHGDFDDFTLILRRVGVIDAERHWSGGASTLVQLGDLLDRGPKEREVMDLLMSLEPEAWKAGGQVVVLLGNHEVMNILGDLRYVTATEYASFADRNSENRRRSAYKQYVAWYKNHSTIVAELPPGALIEPNEPAWMMLHPLGFVEQRQAFAPNAPYGSWLRKHAAVAKIGDTLFLHGGIHPRYSSMSLESMNAQIEDEIRTFDTAKQRLIESGVILPFFTLNEITAAARGQLNVLRKSATQDEQQIKYLESILGMGGWLCVSPDGPLWFRGYAQWDDHQGVAALRTVLQRYGAAHLVVGHTPQITGRIISRFDGEVFMIDTGMLDTYYPFGRASALKIEDSTKFVAEYTDSDEILLSGQIVPEPRTPSLDGGTPAYLSPLPSPQAAPQRSAR